MQIYNVKLFPSSNLPVSKNRLPSIEIILQSMMITFEDIELEK
jgi:hypothetical protein